MKRLFLILCAVSISLSAHAADVLIVKEGAKDNDALYSFLQVCYVPSLMLDSGHMERVDVVQYINRMVPLPPKVIVAIGPKALSKVDQATIPIVYLMIGGTAPYRNRDNITGVSSTISAKDQMRSFQETIPSIKRIGVVYSFLSADLVDEARQIPGVEIIGIEISNPRRALQAMNDVFAKGIDAYWAVLDNLVYYPEIRPPFYTLSFANRTPILSTVPFIMDQAAVVSLDVDPVEMGRRAGGMVLEILRGRWPEPVTAGHTVRTNELIAGKMGILFGDAMVAKANNARKGTD